MSRTLKQNHSGVKRDAIILGPSQLTILECAQGQLHLQVDSILEDKPFSSEFSYLKTEVFPAFFVNHKSFLNI